MHALSWFSTRVNKKLVKTKRYFAHSDAEKERKNVGLGQFVLLLTLTPFIFSLSLYDLGDSDNIASKYLIDPDRFDSLSYEELVSGGNKVPKKPFVRVSSKQRESLKKYFRTTPEALCLKLIKSKPKKHSRMHNACRHYKKQLDTYNKQIKQYRAAQNQKSKEQNYLKKQADSFLSRAHLKPTPPKTEIIEISKSPFSTFLNQFAIEEGSPLLISSTEGQHSKKEDSNKQTSPTPEGIDGTGADIQTDTTTNGVVNNLIDRALNATSFQILTYPAWLLGFLLIFPVIAIAIKRRAWGLVIFGLSVPAYNYALHFISLFYNPFFYGYGDLGLLQLSSPLFAQIALVWFLIRGHIISRAFITFMALLICLTLIPSLLGNLSLIDPSYINHEGYSMLKAQLPLVIFFIAAGMGRLIVKGAKENAVLLKKLGWWPNIKSAAHALILWLPMAILCLPFFYFTEWLLPKHITNQLHENKVLQFDYSHPAGVLDNALQSTAHITDDINFAWHLAVEERKAYFYSGNKEVQGWDFEYAVNKHYSEIVPSSLVFKNNKSDVALVGWLIDLSTEKTQESINRSYQTIRNDIRRNITELAREKEKLIKSKAEDGKDKAINELEAIKREGKKIILANNTSAQSTLWWTINYIQAAHQLALLLFAFICVKSYFYVFARVSFNQNTGTVITLGDTLEQTTSNISETSNQGQSDFNITASNIKACGLDYLISSDKEETYYITRRYQCRGKAPKLCLPQKFRAPFARLFNKAYTMNEVAMKQGDADVSCSATKGIEFFEWNLEEDEKVIFDFHHFVGMTKELQLSTLISPRISSLLLDRMIYSQATGPGKLILMTKGRAEIGDACVNNSTKKVGSFPSERMIAMQLDSKLHVDSELDILNIYFSSAYISPISGKMIIDVDSQRGAKTGLASFIRHFVFPG
ncbi:MAG: hypothetical protein ACRBBR_14435 [Cellvibrionaceae bacterium]